jgi:hypothetical protein
MALFIYFTSASGVCFDVHNEIWIEFNVLSN